MSSKYQIKGRPNDVQGLKNFNYPSISDPIASSAYNQDEIPDFEIQSIIDDVDDRIKVDSKTTPYSAIGVVSSGFSLGTSSGTGSLVASNIVWTCAHNVYNRQRKQRANQVRFVPAQEGLRGEVFVVIDYYFDPRYASITDNQEATHFDYAILVLDRSAEKYGRFGVKTISSDDPFWGNQPISISGYPGDKFVRTPEGICKYQYNASGKATSVDLSMISYKMATWEGNSGAPVFYKSQDGEYYVVGTHNLGISFGSNFNQGVRITKEIYSTLENYINLRIHNETYLLGSIPSQKREKKIIAKGLAESSSSNDNSTEPVLEVKDSRQKVNIGKYPYTAVGTVQVKWGEKLLYGTGFIVGRNAILTTATNIWNANENKKSDSITFYPSLDGQSGKGYRVIDSTILKLYQKNPKGYASYNIAVLQVAQDLQDIYGKFGISVIDDADILKGQRVSLAGYPVDKIVKNEKGVEKYQYESEGRIDECFKGLIYYKIDTAPGNAGSPIYYIEKNTQRVFAVGLHIGTYRTNKQNYGTKISKNKFQQIKTIINRYSESFFSPSNPALASKLKSISDLPIIQPPNLFLSRKDIKEASAPIKAEKIASQESISEQKVFGQYVRNLVKNPLETPYKTIGRLQMFYEKEGKYYSGTGTLVGPNVVLTCGHNVYNRQTGESAKTVTFSPAYTRDSQARGETYTAKLIYVNPAYKGIDQDLATRNDLALLALDENLSEKYGFLGLESVDQSNSFWYTQPLSIVGYPGDLSSTQKQYQAQGVVTRVDETLINHRIDTFGGNSGSAIYYKRSNGQYSIVGIHTGGYNLIRNGVDIGTNYGPRLTKNFITQIKNFVNSNSYFLRTRGEAGNEATLDITSFLPNQPISGQEDYGFNPSPLGATLSKAFQPFINLSKVALQTSSTNQTAILSLIKSYYHLQSNAQHSPQLPAIQVYVQIQQQDSEVPLDKRWAAVIPFAIDRINEAVPGLLLKQVDPRFEVGPSEFVIRVYGGSKEEGAYTIHNILTVTNPYVQFGDPVDFATDYGTVTHQFVHALGFSHQMRRKDRQLGVNVYLDRISQQWRAQYESDSGQFGATPFDPYSLMMYPIIEEWMSKNLKNVSWTDKVEDEANQFLSELDKVALNILYPPRSNQTNKYNPLQSSKNGLYYCGRTLHQNSDLRFTSKTQGTYVCGPQTGPNCPSCRVFKNPKLQSLLESGDDDRERWQGWSGNIYCFKKIGSKKCGPNTGDACSECTKLLNGENN